MKTIRHILAPAAMLLALASIAEAARPFETKLPSRRVVRSNHYSLAEYVRPLAAGYNAAPVIFSRDGSADFFHKTKGVSWTGQRGISHGRADASAYGSWRPLSRTDGGFFGGAHHRPVYRDPLRENTREWDRRNWNKRSPYSMR